MPRTTDLDDDALIALLEEQNATLGFDSFDHDDAFRLGSDIIALGVERGLSFTTSILFGQQRVFHAARGGTTADNDFWLERKARVVARFDAPSLLIGTRCRAAGVDFHDVFALDPALYVPAGGGFPLRVNGSLSGFVGVSGLPERDDHDLVVTAIEAARARRS